MPAPGGAFDEHHPPDAALIGDCVHCGFCLPTCPTYVLWGEEMDSPRGRIYLMKEGLEGEPMTDSMVAHFDACLGCMACVTACPSGVQYDTLIEQTRAQVERHHDRSREGPGAARPDLRAVPAPAGGCGCCAGRCGRSRPAASTGRLRRTGLLDRLAPQLAAMERLAPRLGKPRAAARATSAASGPRRAVVGLLTGCVQGAFFPGVNAATARVLQAEGCDVVVPRTQGCCGALSVHNGREAEAQGFARALVDAFEATGVEYVVVNAAGCGSTMKEYADLLADDPAYAERAKAFADRVRDVSEILDELGPVAPRHPLEMTVAYHDACHLGARPGRPRPAAPRCSRRSRGWSCGRSPRPSSAAARPASTTSSTPSRPASSATARPRNIVATGAEVLVTANPGCLMQVHLRHRARPGTRWASPTPSRCSTPPSAALPSTTLLPT